MTPERWAEVKRVFDDVLEQPAGIQVLGKLVQPVEGDLGAIAGTLCHRNENFAQRKRVEHISHVGTARRHLVRRKVLQIQLTDRKSAADAGSHNAEQRVDAPPWVV